MKKLLHHLFFPHHTNHHKARVLHHDGLLFALSLFLFASTIISSMGVHVPAVLGATSAIAISDLLNDTNQQRNQYGLPSLHLDDQLNNAAAAKAADMFAKDYWAHVSPDGTTPWVFIKNAGYNYIYAGENLARGFNTAQDVVNAWMNSPSHRENMLSPNYQDVGFAVYDGVLTGSQTILVVQEFGQRYQDQPSTAPVGEVQVSPSQAPVLQISPTPVVSLSPTPLPTAVPSPVVTNAPTSSPAVAATANRPLVESISTNKNLSVSFLLFLIIVLVLDIIIIERKKVTRLVVHNIDHLVFLVVILIAGIIIGRGVIL